MTSSNVTRRCFIGGTAGAGALSAALASLGIADGTIAEGDGGSTTDTEGSTQFRAQALPTFVPGARVGLANFVDAQAMNTSTGAYRQYANPGVYNLSGWLNVPLDLPGGARLLRIDAYAAILIGSAPANFSLRRTLVSTGSAVLNDFGALAGTGFLQATYAPTEPLLIDPGSRFYLETSSCNVASRVFVGAVYQYYDANPQLNLLPTPIRVYDSRAGATPTTVAKGQLANDATRIIDCTLGGAVPAGAAAAMITLTTVGTVGAGYMALWRNGLADPGTSSINWDHNGTNVAVTTVVALDAAAKLMAKTGPNASTDFIIDVIGFYA